MGTYHVRIRHLQSIELARRPERRYFVQTQRLGAKAVNQVAEALPSHHLNKGIGHEIGVVGVDVAGLDVCQGVGKLDRGRVWKAGARC